MNFEKYFVLQFQNIAIDLMFDTLLAYIFYILIESPFTNLFGVVFSRKSVEKSDHLDTNNNS